MAAFGAGLLDDPLGASDWDTDSLLAGADCAGASMRHRDDASTSTSPPSGPVHAPCECTTCRNLRRTESRTGSNQTTARGVRPAAGRRGQSTHEGSLEAAARLPVRLARGIHACICKQQHRDAS